MALREEELAQAEEMYREDPDIHKAQLGIEARAFWNSKIGQYFEEKVASEIEEAVADLLSMDPEDDKVVWRRKRLRIQVAQTVLIWMAEALAEGELAIDNLDNDTDHIED